MQVSSKKQQIQYIAMIGGPFLVLLIIVLSFRFCSGGENQSTNTTATSSSPPLPTIENYTFDCTDDNRDALIRDVLSKNLASTDKKAIVTCLNNYVSPDSRIIIEKETGNDYSTFDLYVQNTPDLLLEIIEINEREIINNQQVLRIRTKIKAPKINNQPTPTPSNNSSSTSTPENKELPLLYQGKMEGNLRRVQLENVKNNSQLTTFTYTIIGSGANDRNQEGSIDWDAMTVDFSSIGMGTISKKGTIFVLDFPEYNYTFESIN